ncbi:MAG: hypothetical protein HQL45_15665 [Alphaproteobacteria bacterium]|nr:hypothetical protein [Alphaproteobacteria bacterium]
MSAPTHACHAPGCNRLIQREHLMCPKHWYMLPDRLRRAINRNWRMRDHEAHAANCREAQDIILRQEPHAGGQDEDAA